MNDEQQAFLDFEEWVTNNPAATNTDRVSWWVRNHPEIYEQYMDSTNWRYQQPSGTGKIQPTDKKKISSSFKEDALKITIAFLVGAFLMLAFSL